VYFLTPDYDWPAGGIRVVYQHVDYLNAAGIPAAVMHQSRNFRITWFDHSTPTTNVKDRDLGPRDLLVVGELDLHLLASRPVPRRYVIFNQGCFLTWRRNPSAVDSLLRDGPRPEAMITVSEYSRQFLATAFPGTEVVRIHLGLDIAEFRPPRDSPPPVITFMPRRGGDHLDQVLRLLRDAPQALGFRLQPLHGLRHDEVAAALRASSVFLSFAAQEGFGLPAAEAMACGNYVIGFDGLGGKEFFLEDFCSPIPQSDTLAFAREIVRVLEEERRSPGWLRHRGAAAASHIAEHYASDVAREEVVRLYRQLLESR
jgi:hypothetical protein